MVGTFLSHKNLYHQLNYSSRSIYNLFTRTLSNHLEKKNYQKEILYWRNLFPIDFLKIKSKWGQIFKNKKRSYIKTFPADILILKQEKYVKVNWVLNPYISVMHPNLLNIGLHVQSCGLFSTSSSNGFLHIHGERIKVKAIPFLICDGFKLQIRNMHASLSSWWTNLKFILFTLYEQLSP